MEGQTQGALSRRNSVRSNTGSRRQSLEGEGTGDQGGTNIFGQMKPLKKSKPVSTVKITFMGKPMVKYYYLYFVKLLFEVIEEDKMRVNIQRRNVN